MRSDFCLRGSTARPLAAPVLQRLQSVVLRRCQLVVPRISSSQESVTDEEAERFEKIAAALVEKLKDLPDDEPEPEGAFETAGCQANVM